MVTIIDYKQSEKDDGKSFFKLQLQGGTEAVLSQSSGKFYLTARTCSIPTTFDEETCKRLVGTQMKGSVVKVETDPYEYTVPETGEVINLSHQWVYDPFELMSQADHGKPASREKELV